MRKVKKPKLIYRYADSEDSQQRLAAAYDRIFNIASRNLKDKKKKEMTK